MTVNCYHCNKVIKKSTGEFNRNIKLGRKFYCDNKCAGFCKAKNLPVQTKESAAHLPKGRKKDVFSAFRTHLKLARRRDNQCNLTLGYLKEIWEKQKGTCPYTGWHLDNPESTTAFEDAELHPRRASLDRIDSSIGYAEGNVQFVAVIANFAKHQFKEEELIRFCRAVVLHYDGKEKD